jgi:outer membrane protein
MELRTGLSKLRKGRLLRRVGLGVKAVALGAALVAAPVPGAAETLADALVLAYRNSNLLAQNRALLRAADEDVASAVAQLRPVINFVAGSSYAIRHAATDSLTSSARITLDVTLFDSGAGRLAVEAAKETVLATREALRLIEQNVLLGAVQAYMGVIRAREFVVLRQNNVRVIAEQLRAARDRFEVGEITSTEVSLAEARLAAARSALAAAEGDLQVAREAYKAAIGTYPGQLASPSMKPLEARTLEAAKAIAEREHPAIAQVRHSVAAAELNIERARAAMKPRITGSLSTQVDSLGPWQNSAGINLTVPLYAGGGLSSAYRRAVALRDAERANLLQTTLQVAQQVGNAWAQLAVATASLEATDRQVRAATVAYRGVSEEARLGARTTLDVLDAEQELLDARVAQVSARTDQLVAHYALLSAMGLLTVEHLGLGVATYDPEAYYNAVKDAPSRAVSPEGRKLDRILKEVYGK